MLNQTENMTRPARNTAPAAHPRGRPASSERTIPSELLVCGHLSDSKDLGTLASILRTGSLGYDVAGPALYRELVVDDDLPSFLRGLEHE